MLVFGGNKSHKIVNSQENYKKFCKTYLTLCVIKVRCYVFNSFGIKETNNIWSMVMWMDNDAN